MENNLLNVYNPRTPENSPWLNFVINRKEVIKILDNCNGDIEQAKKEIEKLKYTII